MVAAHNGGSYSMDYYRCTQMFKKHNDKRTYAAALTCIDCNCGLDNIEIAQRLVLNTQYMFFCFSFLSLWLTFLMNERVNGKNTLRSNHLNELYTAQSSFLLELIHLLDKKDLFTSRVLRNSSQFEEEEAEAKKSSCSYYEHEHSRHRKCFCKVY